MSTERTEQIMEVVGKHTVMVGVMCSMNHWAYHHPEGQWFAHCGDGWPDHPGCGWNSEPHCYPTKEEARKVGDAHIAEMIEEVLIDG